jgi:hypothetical protein
MQDFMNIAAAAIKRNRSSCSLRAKERNRGSQMKKNNHLLIRET